MKCLVAVAHPDDEVLWMGGTIIRNSLWEWHVLSLCRRDDADRAPRFHNAARALNAHAYISDLDDGSPTPAPLSSDLYEIKDRILSLVPRGFDLVFTHGPDGEYTRHERHEQVHRAVRELIESGMLEGDLVCFAYDDCGGRSQPRPAPDANLLVTLTQEELAAKQRIIRDIYGFQPGSFEFEAAGQVEAFSVTSDTVFRDFDDSYARLLGTYSADDSRRATDNSPSPEERTPDF